eukprot:scaffold3028_cov174-Amphora_coffeaeformis.AAC.25
MTRRRGIVAMTSKQHTAVVLSRKVIFFVGSMTDDPVQSRRDNDTLPRLNKSVEKMKTVSVLDHYLGQYGTVGNRVPYLLGVAFIGSGIRPIHQVQTIWCMIFGIVDTRSVGVGCCKDSKGTSHKERLVKCNNLLLGSGAAQDIGITGINNGQDGTVEEFTASRSQGRVVSRVVMHLGLGQHGHVFNFRLAQMRAVAADEDHLGLVAAQRTTARLVAETDLAGTHDQLQTAVHRVLLLLLCSRENMKGWNGLESEQRDTRWCSCPSWKVAENKGASSSTTIFRDYLGERRIVRSQGHNERAIC